ncbi:serine/threonine-protein kinase RsbW [Streptomyces sp. TLI_235]|nr:ATP-binding protein [Streptomyces sp. TLI_235]PBC70626.1 serine/threonine-protein kinase RsbW [Streptomyces sp. TLI_235]
MEPQALELPSEVASVHLAASWAGGVAAACGLGEDGSDRLALAVHEAVANAVLHGNRQDAAKRVRLAWQVRGDRLRITVGDDGSGFVPPPPADRPNLTPSGRGLVMIGHLTDGYRIVHRDDPPGTDVVLELDLTSA